MTPPGYPMQVSGFNPKILTSLWETPAFLHCAGDGDTPTIGPALTTTGVITEGSPIVLAGGGALRTEDRAANSYRLNTANFVNPSAGDDMIIAVCAKLVANAGGVDMVLGTFNTVPDGGWQIYRSASNSIRWYSKDDTGAFSSSTFNPVDPLAPLLMLVRVPFGAIGKVYTTPTNAVSTAASPGNSIGKGIGIGARPYPLSPSPLPAGSLISWACAWYGAGLYTAWTAARIAQFYALAGVL